MYDSTEFKNWKKRMEQEDDIERKKTQIERKIEIELTKEAF